MRLQPPTLDHTWSSPTSPCLRLAPALVLASRSVLVGEGAQHVEQDCVPAVRSVGSVCSAGLWQMPPADGTKIIPAGQTRASICAS